MNRRMAQDDKGPLRMQRAFVCWQTGTVYWQGLRASHGTPVWQRPQPAMATP